MVSLWALGFWYTLRHKIMPGCEVAFICVVIFPVQIRPAERMPCPWAQFDTQMFMLKVSQESGIPEHYTNKREKWHTMPDGICSTRKGCHCYSFVAMPHEIRISLISSRSFQPSIRNFLFSQKHKILWRKFIIDCMQFSDMFILLQHNYE
jgi:hypothetical protein